MIAAAPPRPRANPLFGSALDLRRSRIRTYVRVMHEHGDVVRLVVGPRACGSTCTACSIPRGSVLAGSREGYSKSNRFYQQIAEAFGWGLVTSEGELWQRQRRLIQPLFTRRQIASARVLADPANRRAEVRDEALIFLLAGHETTSTALTFTLHLLGRHSTEQRLIHDEIDAVLDGRPPTLEDALALERTVRTIKEAMRLYPPAYAVGRLAVSDQEIGGYVIPAGARVAVSQFATHRHPRFWENPEVFDPTRFTADREAARHRYAYFPFGAGPRSCIGSHFAMLEATIAVAVLLQRFRIQSEPQDVPLDTEGITLRPGGAVPIRLAAR